MDNSTAYPVSQTRKQSNARQGLCHISQLLEMLFLKYGISTEELELANANEAQATRQSNKRATRRSMETPAASTGRAAQVAASCETATPVIATASLAASSSETAQATFDWFQSSELTI